MSDLMKIVLVLSLSGTALAAFLALLRRGLKNRLPHGLFYYLWLLVLLRLMVPVALPVPGLERVMEPPVVESVAPPGVQPAPEGVTGRPAVIVPGEPQTHPGQTVPGVPGQPVSVETPGPRWYERAWDFLCRHFTALWLAGAALHFLWFAVSYFRFCRGLKQDCLPLWEHEQALLDDLRGQWRVEACRSPLAQTPMLVGLIRPRIILPETAITTLQLECILRHELTHLRRRDLLYKWFTVAVTSFHWFNPLMPWLRKEISRCCELSCDEAVIGSMSDDQKRTYGETLLALAAASALPRAVPATTLCEEKKQLKERLVGILKHKHATAVILLLSCLLALLVAGCAAVLGPRMERDTFTAPLTEEEQAAVMENIRVWAAENLETDSEPGLTYSLYNDRPQSVGWMAMYANGCWLYDLHTGEIRAVDGTYADTAPLGMMLAQGQKDGKNRLWAFYLTNGKPTDGADPIRRLEQIAAEYPDGKVRSLTWWRQEDKGIYMTMCFQSDGNGYTCEYSSVTGVLDVLPDDRAVVEDVTLPLESVPGLLDNIFRWQTEQDTPHNGQNYSLDLSRERRLAEILVNTQSQVAVHNLSTGEMTRLEGEYTGSLDYGCITVLGPAKSPFWLYIIDDAPTSEPALDLAGKIFVYEKEGFGSDFTIKLHADGTLGYYEGMLSSHIGMGTWAMDGDILTLHEDTFDWTFRFRVQDGALHFLREGSDQFMYIKVADGARFLEDTYASDILRVYSEVLWNACLKGELPQGENLDWRSVEEAAKNHFSFTDIDGDGRVELLISWTNASMAGHDFVIFDYHDGALHRTDLPFTSLRFYDNGAVEVDWSHSQGWSGRFWPYDVYLYNADTDDYAAFGSVEAWDKQLVSKGFPDDVDADGDGLVYEVRRAGEVLPNDRHYDRRRLMDGPAFEEWRQSYLNGAQEVEIELTPLTEENIAAWGAPKPVAHTVTQSSYFTQQEVSAAMEAVRDYFKNFKDCTMTALWYDEAYSEAVLKYYRPGTYTTENTIVLLCDFTPGKNCEPVFTPGHVQSGWMWIFTKQPDGSWIHVDHGY